MSYSKVAQWDQLSKDFREIEDGEEIIIQLGDRYYCVKVADEDDFDRHDMEGME